MSTQVICDHCQKPVLLYSFNESQTSVVFTYQVYTIDTANDNYNKTSQDVCPHCAIQILTQLVQAWGG